MDEMKLKLDSKFMRGIASKLIAKAIYKKTGYKVSVRLEELDVSVIDGETNIKTNVELKLNNTEFMKVMRLIEEEES